MFQPFAGPQAMAPPALAGKHARSTGDVHARRSQREQRRQVLPLPYPTWLSPGDNAWQLTAATLVGLMSVPGLVVLYGGVMQKRWSINSMMLTFAAFAIVLVVWVLWGFKMAFGQPIGSGLGFFSTFVGIPGTILSSSQETGRASIPL